MDLENGSLHPIGRWIDNHANVPPTPAGESLEQALLVSVVPVATGVSRVTIRIPAENSN